MTLNDIINLVEPDTTLYVHTEGSRKRSIINVEMNGTNIPEDVIDDIHHKVTGIYPYSGGELYVSIV